MARNRKNPSKPKPLPALRYLNAWLHVDPETGLLYWKRKVRGKQIGDVACYPTARGYRSITITYFGKSRIYRAHRICYALYHQQLPSIENPIDHDNRDRGDNSKINLIETTHQLNNLNRGGFA